MQSGNQRSEIIQKLLPYIKYGCLFRLVDQGDAEFIHKLRTDPVLSRYISPVEDDVMIRNNGL